MVKFSFIALTSVLAAGTAQAAGNRNPIRKKTINLSNQRTLRRGDPTTEALLKKARPYKTRSNTAAGRNLEDVEIDGSYSIKFSQCLEVKTFDEDLFGEDIDINYVQSGQIASSQSYVLFHVCQGDNCYYDADADIYIVDLATYLTNVAQYHANKRANYCEACGDFEDYCNAEEEAEEQEEVEEEDGEEEEGGEEEAEEAEEEEGGEENEEDDKDEGEDEEEEDNKDEERKLKKKDRKLISRKLDKTYIDCDQCDAYECFVDEDAQDEADQNRDELDESVSDWIAELAECKESGVQDETTGLDLYLGAMCSPYGDTVELAVFVNEDCTMYTSTQSFANVFDPYNDNEDGMNYLTYAEEFIKSAFTEVTPCLQQEYADPEEEQEEDNDEEENYEMNDYCSAVLEGDFADFNNCQNDENDEDEDNDDAYNWYTYDLAGDDADDINEVCYVLNQKDGEYSYVYNEETSGTWHTRNKNGSLASGEEGKTWKDTIDSMTESMKALSPGIIAAIVGTSLIVFGFIVFLVKGPIFKKKQPENNESVYQGGTMM